MFCRHFGLLWIVLGTAAMPSFAQDCRDAAMTRTGNAPIVVELFTSQGCSSCPPADRFFAEELVSDNSLLALAHHVDYWDYIGWKDTFSHRKFSDRQRAYALHAGKTRVYTPQIIVGGRAFFVGSDRRSIRQEIRRHRAAAWAAAEILIGFDGRDEASPLRISLQPSTPSGLRSPVPYHVVLVGYSAHGHEVSIGAGENRGLTQTYHNVVDIYSPLGLWDGVGEFRHPNLVHRCRAGRKSAIIVHHGHFGPIIASRILDGHLAGTVPE